MVSESKNGNQPLAGKPTNFDVIRSMGIPEMAYFLIKSATFCWCKGECPTPKKDCCVCMQAWLIKAAEKETL